MLVLTVSNNLLSGCFTGYTISSDDEWKKHIAFYQRKKGIDLYITWIEGPMVGNIFQFTKENLSIKPSFREGHESQIMAQAVELRWELA